MTATAGSLISKALGKLSIVTPARRVRADELAVGLECLNDWLDEMRLPPLFSNTASTTVFTLPANTPSRTIGPGAQIDVARPVRIERSSFTRSVGIDRPLDVLTREQYNAISQKTIGEAWPSACFFDGALPIGNVFFWPLANIEVHLVTLTAPGRFANVTTEYDLAPGYENCIVFNLACELQSHMEVAAPAYVVKRAASLRRLIVSSNLKVPQLDVHRPREDAEAAFIRG